MLEKFARAAAAEVAASTGLGVSVAHVVAQFYPGMLATTRGIDDKVPPKVWLVGLKRHLSCDWGDLPPEDVKQNERAFKEGGRLFSRYKTEDGTIFYIITEADRSVTTVMLASEYGVLGAVN